MEEIKCVCGKIFKSLTGLKCHLNKCNGDGTPRDIVRKKKNHVCPKCELYIKTSIEKHINSCTGNGTKRNPLLTIETNNRSDAAKKCWQNEEYRQKQIDGMKKRARYAKENGIKIGIPKTQEGIQYKSEKLRESINKRYANGWQPKAGRCKKIEYESPIAGIIKVDGTWELIVAKYLDYIQIDWCRNTTRFIYFNTLKNREATYCPDFYIPSLNLYIEVKGYETELDRCKWGQFKEKLEIWRKEKIDELKEILHVLVA